MILVDSSAWIEFQRATGSRADQRLTEALKGEEPLATTGTVILEILASARDERHERELRRLLARCRFLPLVEPFDHETAAALYRSCRRFGTTIRRLPACLTATVAIRNQAQLLHCDSDFDALARHSPLTVIPVTSQASWPNCAQDIDSMLEPLPVVPNEVRRT